MDWSVTSRYGGIRRSWPMALVVLAGFVVVVVLVGTEAAAGYVVAVNAVTGLVEACRSDAAPPAPVPAGRAVLDHGDELPGGMHETVASPYDGLYGSGNG